MAVRSSLPPHELWKKIGDFCGMSAWDALAPISNHHATVSVIAD
ncbi:MAG TPA: hypothetical protein VKB08_12395 [Bradyrhizobium sp.]|nr:hypothetical protein [Bradyrhizobium sp.]